MRSESISINERDLMFVIGGQLFDQAPNRQPRNVEVIMQKVRDAFRKEAYNDNEYYALVIPKDNVYKYLEDLLMGIPEFVDLNLSQIEFENNISVNDEKRPKYLFSSRYDKYDSESWKSDFIDLDAFIRNVYNRLINLITTDNDCFLCIYYTSDNESRSLDICKECILNPNLKSNYKCSRKPKGRYTFSCKFNCREQKQICCEECDKNTSCKYVCDGNSKTCGNTTLE